METNNSASGAPENSEAEPVDETITGEQTQSARRARLADSWREVGEQLQEFGARFASAFRTGWAEESQQSAEGQVSGERPESEEEAVRNLNAVADRLDRVLKRAASETESQRAAAMRATRGASERLLSETREGAIVALQALTRQLEALATRLERVQQEGQAVSSEPTPLPSGEPPTTENGATGESTS